MITLLVEGQEIELPEEIAVSDDAIRKAIAPLFPQSANATIQRTTDGQGRTTIKLTKQAGTKGGYPEILKQLIRSRQHINPAFTLAHQLKTATNPRRYQPEEILLLQRQIHSAITQGEKELQHTHAILECLLSAPSNASMVTPLGF